MSTTAVPDRVDTGSGLKNWRIADGKIRSGREVDGSLEERSQILGRLLRIGTHEGVGTNDGKPYAYLEAELEANGEHFRVRTSLESAVASSMFGHALLGTALGDIIVIDARKSDTPTPRGSFVTFVNVSIYNPETGKAIQIRKADLPEIPGESSADRIPYILDLLKEHPAWALRPVKDEGEGGSAKPTARERFEKFVSGKDWPAVDDMLDAYLTVASDIGGRKYTAIADVPDVVWNQMRAAAEELDEVPEILRPKETAKANPFGKGKAEPKAAAKPAAKTADKEYDPFEGE